MTQGLWYFCGISTADETFDIAYSRLPSENKRRIKKKRGKKKCGEREKRKRNMYVRIRKTRCSERNDRQKWLADKENESETNKIDRTRRESRARCRGTLVVFASMGKGQQIHWPRETPVSTEVSPRSPPSSPRTASAIVSLRPSQGPTHARSRARPLCALPLASCFPSNAITRRCRIETNHSICFAAISTKFDGLTGDEW